MGEVRRRVAGALGVDVVVDGVVVEYLHRRVDGCHQHVRSVDAVIAPVLAGSYFKSFLITP